MRKSGALQVLVALASATAHAAPEPTAVEVLEAARAAYEETMEFAGALKYEIEFPDGRREQKEMRFGRRGSDAFMALVLPDGTAVMQVVALGEHLYASQFNVPGAYVRGAYDGDLVGALERIGAGEVGLKAPPPLAAALAAGGGLDSFLESMGFGVLGPLEVAGIAAVTAGHEIELVAANGSCRARFDRQSRRLAGFDIVIGEPGHQVRGSGTLEGLDTAALDRYLTFDPGERVATADFAALEGSAYPLGEPAPDATLPSLAGGAVTLAALRGSVVVLDFWATWCVPCWSALEEIEKLAQWARESGRPVAVYSVNTLEEIATLEEQRAMVGEFLSGRGLSIPTLLDTDRSFFAAMSSPGLPSTVVIAPDGTLARYHAGVVEEMFETLKGEVEELLD